MSEYPPETHGDLSAEVHDDWLGLPVDVLEPHARGESV